MLVTKRGVLLRTPRLKYLYTFLLGTFLTSLAAHAQSDLYVTDYQHGSVLKITPSGVVSTFASGIDDAIGLAFSAQGDLYVGSLLTGQIKKITPAGVVTTFATPTGYGGRGLVFDAAGNLYSANTDNNTISKITPAGVVTTFATGINGPRGLAIDASGQLYVSDTGNHIYRVSLGGAVSVFATGGGIGAVEQINFDAAGNLYAVNESDKNVFKISPTGSISLFATLPSNGEGVAIDGFGTIYLSTYVGDIRRYDSNGNLLSTLTTGNSGFTTASIAFIPEPATVTLAASGLLLLGLRRRRTKS